MGVWGKMPDGTAIHIDFAVKKNCWNMQAYCYGNCYGCGCCAKDKKQRYESRIRYLNEELREREHFDLWDDDPELRQLQEKNVRFDIRWFKRKIRYYTKKLRELEGTSHADGA